MKKIFKLLALSLAFVLLVSSLAACSHKPDGTYKAKPKDGGASYLFDGDEYTYTTASGYILKGTFEIVKQDEDYRIILTPVWSGNSLNDLKECSIDPVNAEYRFENLNGERFEDGHIRIDQTDYFPVK